MLGSLFFGSFFLTFSYLSGQTKVTNELPMPIFAEEKSASIVFVGDMMLDRTIRTKIETLGGEAVFRQLPEIVGEADLVVGNLEGPITHFASESVGTDVGDPGNTRFTFDPQIAGLLASAGVGLVSIGNNHIADFGKEGVADTKYFLERAGVRYVGEPWSTTSAHIETIHGLEVAFVAYNQFISPNKEGVVAAIHEARNAGVDVVIVLAHWGEEYTPEPPLSVRTTATVFAAAGADVIIGTHSHVIGEVEDIGTTRVYYSLGNFIFDQYFSPEVRCGLKVSLALQKRGAVVSKTYATTELYREKDGTYATGCR